MSELINFNTDIYKSYIGIGDKTTPPAIIDRIKEIGSKLSDKGYILRTPGFTDAEKAFESSTENKEIYLPWKKASTEGLNIDDKDKVFRYSKDIPEIARKIVPVYENLPIAPKAMIDRDIAMVLGKDLRSPVKFVLCWTPDGAEKLSEKTMKTGFIGTIITLCTIVKIPVFNLYKADAEIKLKFHLENFDYQEII